MNDQPRMTGTVKMMRNRVEFDFGPEFLADERLLADGRRMWESNVEGILQMIKIHLYKVHHDPAYLVQ